ncbi:MAG: helix-turn-helix transcriptional regulator [Planctomycetota bacterium]|nr:helix-turn-helix transcriptional regulator [Planctomycetota bacterium]
MKTGTIYTLEGPAGGGPFQISRLLLLQGTPPGLRPRRSGEFEFHYVAEGAMTFLSDAGEAEVGAGGWIFFTPEDAYGIRRSERPVRAYHAHFSAGCSGENVHGDLRAWAHLRRQLDRHAPGFARLIVLPGRHQARDPARVERDFGELHAIQREAQPGHALAAEALFLGMLARLTAEVLETLAAGAKPGLSQAQVLVGRALGYIRRNLARPVTLRDLAEHVHVNEAYLARVFKAHTGETVGAAVLRCKLERAKERLLAERASVKEVAASLGFSDALYFSRRFRQREGLSPRAFVQRRG